MIQSAVAMKLDMFDFDGAWIALKFTCNAFITMNPGYAGRTELPENVKACFRSCAMIRPDLGMLFCCSAWSPFFHFIVSTTEFYSHPSLLPFLFLYCIY